VQIEKYCRGGDSRASSSTTYHCGKCEKTGHNAKTCQTST